MSATVMFAMIAKLVVVIVLFVSAEGNVCSSSDTFYQCTHVNECEVFIPGLRAICDVLNNLFTDGPINAVEGRSSGSGTDATLGTEESSTDPQSQKTESSSGPQSPVRSKSGSSVEIHSSAPSLTTTEISSKFVPLAPTGERDLIENNSNPLLTIRSAAEILIAPVNITVPPGATAQFRCRSQGAPAPLTTIAKKGEPGIVDENQFTEVLSERLTAVSIIQEIENVSEQNEGWYQCTTSNMFGTETADAYLRVLDLCTTVSCREGQTCVADYITATAECVCEECPTSNNIVCGTDCKNYFNPCLIKAKNCQEGSNIGILSQGYCPRPSEVELSVPEDEYLRPGDSLRLKCDPGSPSPQPADMYWVKIDGRGSDGLTKVSSGPLLEIRRVDEGDAGEYRCIATQCIQRYESASVNVVIEEVTEEAGLDELNMNKKVCSVYGDPHFSTFDGFTYDYMGVCNYVLAMDCGFASWLIYGKMDKCSKTSDVGSCLSAVSVYMGRTVMELQRGWVINNGGVKMDITEGEVYTDGGMTITFDGRHLKVVLGATGVEVHWDGLVSVHILLPPGVHTCGLCGDNDGNPSNDMVARHSNGVSKSVLEFGNSWEVDRMNRCAAQKSTENKGCTKSSKKRARNRCQTAFSNPALAVCKSTIDPATYIKSCEFDVCSQDWLVNKLAPECVTVDTYVKRCDIAGVKISNWHTSSSCPSMYKIQDIILDEGCPQDVERLLKRRKTVL